MIAINVNPREGDGLYDIHVGDAGDKFLVSHQGYANPGDAVDLVMRLFSAAPGSGLEPVTLTVTYRDGRKRTDAIR